MVSHQPEVALLLHREHVRRLAEDARLPLLRPAPSRRRRAPARPAVVARDPEPAEPPAPGSASARA